MNKLINGVEVPLSPSEIAEYLQREQAFISSQLGNTRQAALQKINSDDNKIYADAIGNKATEYTASENAAQSFKDAGYTGVASELVLAWAEAKGWTTQQAADNILAQATAWRTAAAVIRRKRLKAKEDVRNAQSLSEVTIVMSDWGSFVVSMRTQLGI